MCPKRSRERDRASETETAEYLRRHILAVSAGTGALMLAGCSADTTGADPDGDGSSSDGTDSGGSAAGTFRLLISDQPVAIDDFDELNVSLDRARIFSESAEDGDGEEDEADASEDGESDPDEDEGDEPGDEANETEADGGENDSDDSDEDDGTADEENETEGDPEDEADGPEDDGAADDDQRGFQVIDLDNATVDLTQVVGDKAIGVFEGELEEGRYTKIELYAADVEGIVDGESVDVKIPSGKLQIVKPFEVVAGETLSFVFDINVVKKGQKQAYNLLPVISESGVAGRDVEAEEIEPGASETGDDDGSDSETGGSEETDSEEEELEDEEPEEDESQEGDNETE